MFGMDGRKYTEKGRFLSVNVIQFDVEYICMKNLR